MPLLARGAACLVCLRNLDPHIWGSETKCGFLTHHWEQQCLIPRSAKPKPTGFVVSSQLAPEGRYRRNPGPANTEERSWFWPAQPAATDKYCEWPQQGSLGLHCWSPRPSFKSVPGVKALSALFQAKDMGLMWSSPQQVSAVTQPFSPEGAGSEGKWETGGGRLGAVTGSQAGYTPGSFCKALWCRTSPH